ncbi:hypothetical protein C4D60_Mb01t25110 [Musa balbisiana]|uniref:Uncharacterized protein n=1 Tax=Musa balbisiana TaxID=52838 RepID=A0A4S8JPY7_MUSBA|nr:hypothetical protein C4D60_Mb01t25110 [Musa balbisiana]
MSILPPVPVGVIVCSVIAVVIGIALLGVGFLLLQEKAAKRSRVQSPNTTVIHPHGIRDPTQTR